jgi:hypothetical protein
MPRHCYQHSLPQWQSDTIQRLHMWPRRELWPRLSDSSVLELSHLIDSWMSGSLEAIAAEFLALRSVLGEHAEAEIER